MVVTPENHVAQIVRETLACRGTHQRRQEGSLNVVHGFQFILHRLGSDVARVFHRDRTAVASLDQIHRTHHVGVLKKGTHTVERFQYELKLISTIHATTVVVQR